jgi:hypothetical protein
MQNEGDKQGVSKNLPVSPNIPDVSSGPKYGVLIFVIIGIVVVAVGVFFLFGWVGDSLNGADGDVGSGTDSSTGTDSGNTAGVAGNNPADGNGADVTDGDDAGSNIGDGDGETGGVSTLWQSDVDYSSCDLRKTLGGAPYMNCVVDLAIAEDEIICMDRFMKWPEEPTRGDLVGVTVLDYCWKLLAEKKADASYCANVLDSSYKIICEGFAGGVA